VLSQASTCFKFCYQDAGVQSGPSAAWMQSEGKRMREGEKGQSFPMRGNTSSLLRGQLISTWVLDRNNTQTMVYYIYNLLDDNKLNVLIVLKFLILANVLEFYDKFCYY
jgi:hypothetical protein